MSQSTREKLINSAIKVFSEKGYFNTKVSDIVKDAGVAQGTFYIYFKSKEDIFLHVVQLVVSAVIQVIEIYSAYQGDPKKMIKLFGREIFKILYEYKEIAYIFFFQVICVGKEFQDIYISTSEKIKGFYLQKLKDHKDADIKADILIGYGKRLVEFGMLIEGKEYTQIVSDFEKAVDMVLGE